jgi:hypothetical protein
VAYELAKQAREKARRERHRSAERHREARLDAQRAANADQVRSSLSPASSPPRLYSLARFHPIVVFAFDYYYCSICVILSVFALSSYSIRRSERAAGFEHLSTRTQRQSTRRHLSPQTIEFYSHRHRKKAMNGAKSTTKIVI